MLEYLMFGDVRARKYSKTSTRARLILEYLILGDAGARKYSKTSARAHSILEKFAFDTTLLEISAWHLQFTGLINDKQTRIVVMSWKLIKVSVVKFSMNPNQNIFFSVGISLYAGCIRLERKYFDLYFSYFFFEYYIFLNLFSLHLMNKNYLLIQFKE